MNLNKTFVSDTRSRRHGFLNPNLEIRGKECKAGGAVSSPEISGDPEEMCLGAEMIGLGGVLGRGSLKILGLNQT